jgi:short-subunit dehydrogenase
MSKNIAIITGASSGIGFEFVRLIDSAFDSVDELWLIARNRQRLLEIQRIARHRVRVLSMDLTKEAQIERLEDLLEETGAVVRLLINCAGYGLTGNFMVNSKEGQLGMIRLNCEALTHVTYSVLPYCRANSRILLMASSAAFVPQPGFGVYAATKAYVLSFSRALATELKTKDIVVTAVCPGPVDTPFFDRAEKTHTDSSREKVEKLKKMFLISPDKVARQALYDAWKKKQVSVIGLPMHGLHLLTKYLPHSFLLWLQSGLFRHKPQESENEGKSEKSTDE